MTHHGIFGRVVAATGRAFGNEVAPGASPPPAWQPPRPSAFSFSIGGAAMASTSVASSTSSWQHAPLIYHAAGRTQRQWEQHLMAVNAAGQFTGKWLFDAVIVTTQDVDGQDIMYAALDRHQLHDLLIQEFADAAALNSAAAALAAGYGAPPGRSRSR